MQQYIDSHTEKDTFSLQQLVSGMVLFSEVAFFVVHINLR